MIEITGIDPCSSIAKHSSLYWVLFKPLTGCVMLRLWTSYHILYFPLDSIIGVEVFSSGRSIQLILGGHAFNPHKIYAGPLINGSISLLLCRWLIAKIYFTTIIRKIKNHSLYVQCPENSGISGLRVNP